MEKKIRYQLGKKDKLKSRKIIEQLFKEGKSFSLFPFRIIYLLQPSTANGQLQVGFSVGTRHFKKAVDRNRIKRLMREAYRLQKNALTDIVQIDQNNLQVFFIYTGTDIPTNTKVSEKINTSIKRLQKIAHENNIENR